MSGYRDVFVATAATVAMLSGCASGGLPSFGAEMGMKSVMGKEVRAPYTSVASYYGFVEPGAKPDAVVDGKNFYYLYLWIPAVAPELGVRMMSPVPADVTPEEGDFKAASWDSAGANDAKTAKNYFDTYITFERHATILTPEAVSSGTRKIAEASQWMTLESNDDTSELPTQPSGSAYNSLLRVTDATKLLRGLYRIGFTTYKVGDVQGTFVAQVGAPVKLPGVVIDKTIDGLLAKMNGG